jgi:hypothetical protein
MPPAKSFGSNAGFETIASTSPLCTSSATTAPTRACSSGVSGTNAASAACWRSRSIVSCTRAARHGLDLVDDADHAARHVDDLVDAARAAAQRLCSTPSMPACPITSPC